MKSKISRDLVGDLRKNLRSRDQNSGEGKIPGRLRRFFDKTLNSLVLVNVYDSALPWIRYCIDAQRSYSFSAAMEFQHALKIQISEHITVEHPKLFFTTNPGLIG